MKFLLAFSFFIFGQGVSFNTQWIGSEPGEMFLPDFQTFDYEWQEYSLKDVEDSSVIFLFHPLDNTAAKTRERNLKELSALKDFIEVFSITHEGNWGSNRELGKRINPEYPILFSQPDTRLEGWVRSWEKCLPSALLVKNGEVLAYGEPLAILSIVLDTQEGFEIPPFANSGDLGFWSFQNTDKKHLDPSVEILENAVPSNLTKWVNWKYMNSKTPSSKNILQEGLLMVQWAGEMGQKVKKNLVWDWLDRVIETGPPEGEAPSLWLKEILSKISSWEELDNTSYAWIDFLSGRFESASSRFEESAVKDEGFMASVYLVNSLVSKGLDKDIENPYLILPSFFQEIFESARDSTKAPLMRYFSETIKSQEGWWPESQKLDHFHFLQGVSLYYSNDEDASYPYFEKLKSDPGWLNVLQAWGIY